MQEKTSELIFIPKRWAKIDMKEWNVLKLNEKKFFSIYVKTINIRYM